MKYDTTDLYVATRPHQPDFKAVYDNRADAEMEAERLNQTAPDAEEPYEAMTLETALSHVYNAGFEAAAVY